MAQSHPPGDPAEPLASVLASRSLAAVVVQFVLRPDAAPHFRALQRLTGLASRSLQHEVARLESLGLLRRERVGRRVLHRAVADHPRWPVLRELVRAFAHPAELLRVALAGVPGIEAAFIYGSFAREGAAHAESDVDVIAIGEGLADLDGRVALADVALEAAGLLGREVNVTPYTPERLRARAGSGFLRAVLSAPKTWLLGDGSALPV